MSKKIAYYRCPHCYEALTALVPGKNEVTRHKRYWDSMVECPACKKLHHKRVYPNGRVHVATGKAAVK
jgi:uncharacterized protein with PIN domain